MKVLHLLSVATIGGIEVLCRDIAKENPEQNVFAVLFQPGPIEEQIRQTGAHCYPLYTLKRWNIAKYVKQLCKICKTEQIDIVVIHHEGLLVMLCYMLLQRKLPKLKYIRYLHSVFDEAYYYTYGKLLNPLVKRAMLRMYEKSDKLIAVSECVKDSFLKNFPISREKIRVIYNGVPAELLKKRNQSYFSQKHDKKEPCIQLLYMGRVEQIKGIDILLNALSMVIKERENARLVVLGDGAFRQSCEKLVQKLGIDSCVSFQGFQLEKEKYLEEADIFVCPSRCQEAFGISILEAMAYGIFCIGSRVGGIPEIIQDEGNGFLFENEKSEDLKKKLIRAIDLIQNGQAEAICLNGIKTVEKFAIEKTIEKLTALYEQLV